ncbi:TPA: glycosyltransferase family 2 protein, partial [Enterococcus faecium]|nr:glycosyltransferase family 2 protein [Enterococcus faecium]HCH7632534.1 glycosyltransferase family 2 protein [Enterococcus faecium]HDG0840600.1 glycosyltransferase family 2 protein [Enterococcus faecium]
MNSSDLISVIIPVYNVEKYVGSCLESVCNQTYKNLDIIIVDDGSKDSSNKICEDYALKDSRIRIIHKNNAGLGLARNTGLEHVKGKYVAFIDSDDFVAANYIEAMLNGIKRSNADTCYAGYYEYYDDNNIISKPARYDSTIFTNNAIIEKVLLGMIGTEPSYKVDFILPMSVWHALYSSEIIQQHNIKFPSERDYISEDIIFHISYLQHSKITSFIKDCIYYYRCNNNNSLTHNFRDNEFDCNIELVKKIEGDLSYILENEIFVNKTRRLLLGRCRTCIQKAVRYASFNKEFDLNSYLSKILMNDELIACIHSYPYKQNPIKQRIFNYFLLNQSIIGVK